MNGSFEELENPSHNINGWYVQAKNSRNRFLNKKSLEVSTPANNPAAGRPSTDYYFDTRFEALSARVSYYTMHGMVNWSTTVNPTGDIIDPVKSKPLFDD
jgi:hypothetical protein